MRIALATRSNLPAWEMDDRPLHRAFEARGVEVLHPRWDDGSVDYSRVDAVLIRTTWDYQERRDAFLAWAEHVAAQSVLLNPLEVVRWNTHKGYLDDLAQHGVAVVPTIRLGVGCECDVRALLRERGWKRGFLKPAIGSTARETLRFDDSDSGIAAAEAHLDRLLRREEMMLQPYLSSVETVGEMSAIWIDGEITHCVRKVPVQGDYRVQDDFGAHDEPWEFSQDELAIAQRAIAAIPFDDVLYARADFLRDDDGSLVMNELEAVEPSLFFRHGPHAAERLAEAVARRVGEGKSCGPRRGE